MARYLSHIGPNLGPSWNQNGVQIGPQTASNFITHSILILEPSWSVFKPFMSASWLSERAIFERPSLGFEGCLDLQASLSTRRWSVSQEPLEPHLGTQNRSKNRSKNQASKGSTTYTLWNRFRTALGPDFGRFGSQLGAHVGPKLASCSAKRGVGS